ncbi:hypothetical protein, partial [Labrenzia sp. DG1229]|uniref:hypothetical protein n=1 Tax=Labrenzia sp. DG1229 TaxID=681847 RepID=UPI00055FCC96
MKEIAQKLWARFLHLGDISGKLMTLVALPSALFAVIVFYDEIGDTLTSPDVRADVQSVGLRCGVALDVIPSDVDPTTFAIEECFKAPISAWVKLDLENEDAVDRTLAAVALRIHFPDDLKIADTPLIWTEARVVNHVLQNDTQVSQRWPWR